MLRRNKVISIVCLSSSSNVRFITAGNDVRKMFNESFVSGKVLWNRRNSTNNYRRLERISN